MADKSALYITSVAHGMVLARSPNGQPSGVVAQNRGDQDAPQKWICEPGDSPNIIALRCASNNEYLHANGGSNWATVGTGAKQWWKLDTDNVTAPGACRLSPVEYPKVFLNHFQGIRVAKGQSMKVHMWQWEQPNQFCLTWYFFPADGSFGPNARESSAVSDGKKATDAKIEELEASKRASDAKLRELQDSKRDYDAKLAELEEGKKGSAATIAELQDKLARNARELDKQNAALQRSLDDQAVADAQRVEKKALKKDTKAHKKEEKAARKSLKMEQAKRLPPSPPASPPLEKVTLPVMGGVAKEVRNECKHVVLPPPRKIRRKVVGIVYAQ